MFCLWFDRIALCIDDQKRFCTNSHNLLGKEAIKRRQLKLVGYEVVQVSLRLSHITTTLPISDPVLCAPACRTEAGDVQRQGFFGGGILPLECCSPPHTTDKACLTPALLPFRDEAKTSLPPLKVLIKAFQLSLFLWFYGSLFLWSPILWI